MVACTFISHTNMSVAWKLVTVSEEKKFAKVNHGGTTMKAFVTRNLHPPHSAEHFKDASEGQVAKTIQSSQPTTTSHQ